MSNPKASILIIGNEILSGRTLDTNTQNIALTLAKKGIIVVETRTIADDENSIIENIRELSKRYDYVFTSGGIGPTHDDITVESIAKAFELPCECNQEICKILQDYCIKKGELLDEPRKKMTYLPKGAQLISNDITLVPGFYIQNVYVLAGIPNVNKAMLNSVLPKLKTGDIINSKIIDIVIVESKIAKQLSLLQDKYPDVEMGSYPFTKGDKQATSLVLRSSNNEMLERSYHELNKICIQLTS